MKRLIALAAGVAALAGFDAAAHAQDIVRGGDPKSPIASVVTVPDVPSSRRGPSTRGNRAANGAKLSRTRLRIRS